MTRFPVSHAQLLVAVGERSNLLGERSVCLLSCALQVLGVPLDFVQGLGDRRKLSLRKLKERRGVASQRVGAHRLKSFLPIGIRFTNERELLFGRPPLVIQFAFERSESVRRPASTELELVPATTQAQAAASRSPTMSSAISIRTEKR